MNIGAVTVEIADGRTITTFPNGTRVVADHAEQPGQAETARECGYASAHDLNREHDLVHSLLASWLGLDCSPTLLGVASGRTYPHWPVEEAAVLAVQRYANVLGVDLTKLASE